MERIKINLYLDEQNKVMHYKECEIVDSLPEIGAYWKGIDYTVTAVKPVAKDPEQPTSEAYNFSVYAITHKLAGYENDPEEDEFTDYVAIEEQAETFEVYLRSWISGSGWQYSTKIDDLKDYTTAAEYIAACNENMDVTPWAYPAENEAFAIEIQDANGNELSQAWTEGEQ